MSLLSQFFPSGGGGGGGSNNAQKIEILLVGGGGGSGASGGNLEYIAGATNESGAEVGGGGGGGQVVVSDALEVLQDVSYPIVIGAGGAGGGFDYDPCIYKYPNPGYIENTNSGTEQGSNGGNTCFGTLIAYGGGGGGAGAPNCSNSMPLACNRTVLQNNPRLTARGGDGGTGGGSGSGSIFAGYYPTCTGPNVLCTGMVNRADDSRPGRAIYNFSNQTSKLGQDGIYHVGLPDFIRLCQQPGVSCDLNSYVSYATGGGGNRTIYNDSYICLSSPKNSVQKFYCPGSIDANSEINYDSASGYYAYSEAINPGPAYGLGLRSINAFMEGNIGARGCANQVNDINDWMGHLRGGDGYHTHITPTPEYYGGGGGVAHSGLYGVDPVCKSIIGGTIAPDNPCYPSPCWQDSPQYAHMACPFGGLGGGGSVQVKTSIGPLAPGDCLGNLYGVGVPNSPVCTFPGSFVVGTGGPAGSQCLQNNSIFCSTCLCGTANCGGGGASLSAGKSFISTGPTYVPPPGCLSLTSCAFCGYAGGSGTVVVRYPTVFCAATVTGNTPITPQSGYHVYRFNGAGTITFPSS